uniref:Uncharacterized protein n=1 Tax=Lactuca sativa TaxID=4236 RepID=A0A9R1VE65_LACSA|nr:hypothetical protein LSAT_V11C500243380 [Lactuca sativa]
MPTLCVTKRLYSLIFSLTKLSSSTATKPTRVFVSSQVFKHRSIYVRNIVNGGAVNDGAEAVNEVHMQQDYDEVELTPLEFDASANGEPSHVHVQEQEARETPLATLLKKIRRKKSERIIKLKLGKKVGGNDAPGNSEAKHVTLE